MGEVMVPFNQFLRWCKLRKFFQMRNITNILNLMLFIIYHSKNKKYLIYIFFCNVYKYFKWKSFLLFNGSVDLKRGTLDVSTDHKVFPVYASFVPAHQDNR